MMIKNMTDQQIRDELAKREAQRAEEARKKTIQLQDLSVKNIDTLLELTPDHGRTSCSDENPCNSDRGRCDRCALMKIKKDQCNLDYLVGVYVREIEQI